MLIPPSLRAGAPHPLSSPRYTISFNTSEFSARTDCRLFGSAAAAVYSRALHVLFRSVQHIGPSNRHIGRALCVLCVRRTHLTLQSECINEFWSRVGMLCWRHFKYTAGNQPTFLKYKSRSRPVTRHVTTAISWIAANVVDGKCVRDSKLSSERVHFRPSL